MKKRMEGGKIVGVMKRPGTSAQMVMVSPELHELQVALGCKYLEYVRMGLFDSFVVWCSVEANLGPPPEKNGKPTSWVNLRNPQNPDGGIICGNVLALGNNRGGASVSLTAVTAVEVMNRFRVLAVTEKDFSPLKSRPHVEHKDFRKVANKHPLFCTCIFCGFAD